MHYIDYVKYFNKINIFYVYDDIINKKITEFYWVQKNSKNLFNKYPWNQRLRHVDFMDFVDFINFINYVKWNNQRSQKIKKRSYKKKQHYFKYYIDGIVRWFLLVHCKYFSSYY